MATLPLPYMAYLPLLPLSDLVPPSSPRLPHIAAYPGRDLRATFVPLPVRPLPTPRIGTGLLPASPSGRPLRTRDEWAEAVAEAVRAVAGRNKRARANDDASPGQLELRLLRSTDVTMVKELHVRSRPRPRFPFFRANPRFP